MNLTIEQYDALREIINIGVGKAANTLNLMTNKHIKLIIPEIKLMNLAQLKDEISADGKEELSSVNLNFRGKFSGSARLIFPTESALKLVSTFASDDSFSDDDDLDAIRAGTLTEIGNVVLNSLIGTISNILSIHLIYTPPNYTESTIAGILIQDDANLNLYHLFARTRFIIEELHIIGDFLLFFEVGSLDELMKMVDKSFAGV